MHRELPIIFSDPMVNAILEGRKTQTRRLIRPQPRLQLVYRPGKGRWNEYSENPPADRVTGSPWGHEFICPWRVGDHPWGKETYRYFDWTEDGEPWIEYRADGAKKLCTDYGDKWALRLSDIWADLSSSENLTRDEGGGWRSADRKWRSARFMPRWVSRIALEVTDVRAERLQDISEEDSIAEGIRELPLQRAAPGAWWAADASKLEMHRRTPVEAFRKYWDSLYAKRLDLQWAASPWVWCISFKRLGAA